MRRHVDLVHAAALRRTRGDVRQAQEVTQQVFIDLAKKSAALARHPALTAWLHRATRFAATNLLREAHRRSTRETAAATDPALAPEPTAAATSARSADWTQLAPVLDAALDTLGERDRQTILLRYFAQKPFAVIAARLDTTEAAAQMRAARALEKLRRALAARGVTSTATALGVALTGHAVSAAPASVAASTLAALATAGNAATAMSISSFLATSLLKHAATGLACATLSGVVTYHAVSRQTSPPPPAASFAPTGPARPATSPNEPRIDPLVSDNAALRARLAALEADLAAEPAGSPRPAAPNAALFRDFSAWTPAALDAVRAAEQTLHRQLDATGLGTTRDWNEEMRRMELEIELEHTLALRLTDAQFHDYIRRKSVTARALERPLTALGATPAEAEAIFAIERDFALAWGAYGGRPSPDTPLHGEWQAARAAADQRLRSALGPARHTAWLAARETYR
jgi:RNA polymerase sigma factor (sigma-70 family)